MWFANNEKNTDYHQPCLWSSISMTILQHVLGSYLWTKSCLKAFKILSMWQVRCHRSNDSLFSSTYFHGLIHRVTIKPQKPFFTYFSLLLPHSGKFLVTVSCSHHMENHSGHVGFIIGSLVLGACVTFHRSQSNYPLQPELFFCQECVIIKRQHWLRLLIVNIIATGCCLIAQNAELRQRLWCVRDWSQKMKCLWLRTGPIYSQIEV